MRVLSLVVPSAHFYTEISRTTLHYDLVQETIRESNVWESNQHKSSRRRWCPAFVSIMRLVSLTKSNRKANNTPLLHVSLKNQQRQIPQIFVCPVDSCRILCLLRTLRVQQSQARQRVISLTGIPMCVCVCVCFPAIVFQ